MTISGFGLLLPRSPIDLHILISKLQTTNILTSFAKWNFFLVKFKNLVMVCGKMSWTILINDLTWIHDWFDIFQSSRLDDCHLVELPKKFNQSIRQVSSVTKMECKLLESRANHNWKIVLTLKANANRVEIHFQTIKQHWHGDKRKETYTFLGG